MLSDNVVQITSSSILDSLNNPNTFNDQLIVAVNISAIFERMGDRWPRRREQVWEHLSRVIEQRLKSGERSQRITETVFLITLMRDTRAESIGVASHALQDSLHFFLGSAELEDIHLQEVKARVGAELSSEAVSAREIRAAAASWNEAWSGGAGELARRSPSLTLRTASGRSLDVMIAIQRLRLLAPDRPSVARASPHVSDSRTGRALSSRERGAMEVGDLAAIDTAVLTLARQMWEKEPEMGPTIVPLSFHTVSLTGARSKLLQQAGIIANDSRTAMICEIVDVAPGTPAGRICQALATTQVFTRGVFIEAKELADLKHILSGRRLMGLTFDASDYRTDQAAALTRRLAVFADVGKTFVRGLIAHSLPCPAMLEICGAAGLTHAGVSTAPSSPTVRINPEPLCAAV